MSAALALAVVDVFAVAAETVVTAAVVAAASGTAASAVPRFAGIQQAAGETGVENTVRAFGWAWENAEKLLGASGEQSAATIASVGVLM